MLIVSFSTRDGFYSFSIERAGEIISALDKFLKSHKIDSNALDFFHLQLSEESGFLDRAIAQAVTKAKQIADFWGQ